MCRRISAPNGRGVPVAFTLEIYCPPRGTQCQRIVSGSLQNLYGQVGLVYNLGARGSTLSACPGGLKYLAALGLHQQ
jgi:hypothetical protein